MARREVSQRQNHLVRDKGDLTCCKEPGGTLFRLDVRYLCTNMFEGRPACSRLLRLSQQVEDVFSVQAARKKVPLVCSHSPQSDPLQEVLWIFRKGPHTASRDVQQHIFCLVGVGWSHVACIAAIDHENTDRTGCLLDQV